MTCATRLNYMCLIVKKIIIIEVLVYFDDYVKKSRSSYILVLDHNNNMSINKVLKSCKRGKNSCKMGNTDDKVYKYHRTKKVGFA